MRVFNLGSINIDHVYGLDHFVQPGETLSSLSLASFAGGKGFNQSVALARAGVDVRHIGAVGTDGQALIESLSQDKASIGSIRVHSNVPTGHAIIQVTPKGENCIIIAAGSNACITPDDIESALVSAEPDDIFLAQNETSSIAEGILIAKRKGMRIALNPAPMNANVLTFPLELVDILIVNETEAAELLNLCGCATHESSHKATLEALHQHYPAATIVMTLGSQGVMLMHPSGETSCANCFNVNPTDTTAAGDTFTGYYLAAVIQQFSAVDALRYASAAAAISVTRAGASPSVPSKSEVKDFLASLKF